MLCDLCSLYHSNYMNLILVISPQIGWILDRGYNIFVYLLLNKKCRCFKISSFKEEECNWTDWTEQQVYYNRLWFIYKTKYFFFYNN